MSEISNYALGILGAAILFGLALALMHVVERRRQKSVAGAVRNLEGKAVSALERSETLEKTLGDEDLLPKRPALYGIPYLAWILTSLTIVASFLIFFFENLAVPYPLPQEGSVARISYRAPAAFSTAGRFVERGEVLVGEGRRVLGSDRELLAQALRNRTRVRPQLVMGTILLLILFSFILLYHMNILYPTSTEKNKSLILIYLVMLLVLASAKLSVFYGFFSPYLIPVPWAGMTITILVNRRIVPLTMLILTIFVALIAYFDFGLFLVLLSGGLVSGTWFRRARKRSEVLVASLLLGFVMTLVVACTSMLAGEGLVDALRPAAAALGNGPFSGLLTVTLLPLFEWLFDLTSPFRLMELLDLNTPLLKELFFKAPGTYQHSMAVANISEMVATEIGANDLLVRVGSYYHDIGKMFNPQYFIENQDGTENPHDALGPVASAAVLRSHVSLGVRLAEKIGLPRPLIDFITEHHGTSTIDYFYQKSRRQDSEIKSERVFKYPGPKPQSRETAIVMLVDSTEAASRTLKTRDKEAVQQLVKRIVNRKVEQGELDRSGLTVGELKKIVDVLTHILQSVSHRRINYPSEKESS